MKALKVFFYSILIVALTGIGTSAMAGKQVLLGKRHVTDRSETDTISVGTGRGTFSGLRVDVAGSAVEFKRITIHFENGGEQVLEKNRIIRKGNKSRVLDLEGHDRYIDRVVFRYEARSRGWKGAEIKLFGIR